MNVTRIKNSVTPDKNNKSNEINDFDIWNPPNNDPTPSANNGFVTLLPIKFPTPISVAFLKKAVIEKISSGSDVPTPIINIEIIYSDTPNNFAVSTTESTNTLDANMIKLIPSINPK